MSVENKFSCSSGFGDDKFIPDIPRSKLEVVAKEVLGGEEFAFYVEHCFPRMFEYCSEVRQLGLFPPKGITTYFSANCTEEDGRLVTAFLASKVSVQVPIGTHRSSFIIAAVVSSQVRLTLTGF